MSEDDNIIHCPNCNSDELTLLGNAIPCEADNPILLEEFLCGRCGNVWWHENLEITNV
jgi:hypothetical protein